MKIYKLLLLICLLAIIFCFCNNKSKETHKVNYNIQTDTFPNFKREIFIDKFGKYDIAYQLIKKDVERARLRVLDNGFDSIAIRLWYIYFEPRTQIVELRKDKGKWVAQFFTIKRHISDDTGDTLVDVIRDIIIPNPKSGWDTFTKKLFELNITTLPNSSDIFNYDPPMDGDFIVVEIATREKYRIYNYLSPGYNSKIKEAKNIEDIMKLIEDEFGEKRLKEF